MEKEKNSDDKVEAVENGGLQPALSRDRQHLNPQPSNDPADPLNWPMALKVRKSIVLHNWINADENLTRLAFSLKFVFWQHWARLTLRSSILRMFPWLKNFILRL
jgi:hypothetical protein